MSDGKKAWYESIESEETAHTIVPGMTLRNGINEYPETNDHLMIQPVINGFIVTVLSGGYHKDDPSTSDRLVFSTIDDLAEGVKLFYSKEHETNESS